MAKLNRKLNDLRRAADKRALRLRRMTPEERRAYDEWQKAHEPTSAAARKRKKEERRQARETRARILGWEIEAAIRDGVGVFA